MRRVPRVVAAEHFGLGRTVGLGQVWPPRPRVPHMNTGPGLAEVAALLGDPARANILAALLDGRALTASELAYAAGVTPQTTSGHLAKLAGARLVAVEKQGRHRYYRLA